ncbi:hypothetical protein [Sinorhizobium meliloti]|nr:hypothetical protein [Sinorhizobium meliloti]
MLMPAPALERQGFLEFKEFSPCEGRIGLWRAEMECAEMEYIVGFSPHRNFTESMRPT